MGFNSGNQGNSGGDFFGELFIIAFALFCAYVYFH
jgi:hypothetical protein